jgi:hypothetical protein
LEFPDSRLVKHLFHFHGKLQKENKIYINHV